MATDTGFVHNACAQYEIRLEDYLDGALSAAEAQSVEQHWRDCVGCRAALERAFASGRLLRVVGPSEGPGPAFARTVMARIQAEQEALGDRSGFWLPLVTLGWRVAATATVVLGVLVTYDAGWGRHAQPDRNTARLIRVSDIFAPDPANAPASRDEVLMMEAETNHGN